MYKLERIYSKARPRVIYRGPVKQLTGNTKVERESVEVAKISTMKLFPILAFPSITKRLVLTQNQFVKSLLPVPLRTKRF